MSAPVHGGRSLYPPPMVLQTRFSGCKDKHKGSIGALSLLLFIIPLLLLRPRHSQSFRPINYSVSGLELDHKGQVVACSACLITFAEVCSVRFPASVTVVSLKQKGGVVDESGMDKGE